MHSLLTLSAAQLVAVHNAMQPAKPAKKFENRAAALARTEAAIAKAGMTEALALQAAGFGRNLPAAPAKATPQVAALPGMAPLGAVPPAPTVRDLASGAELPKLTQVHGPVRRVSGDPKKAARKVAKAAVEQMRQERAAAPSVASENVVELRPAAPAALSVASVAPAVVPAVPVDGRKWQRSNGCVPALLDAMRATGGATLAELTALSGWAAPVELRNLRLMEKKRGVKIGHDGAAGAARRYFVQA